MKLRNLLLFSIVLSLCLAFSPKVYAQRPISPYLYHAFDKSEVVLYPYVGRNIALLIPSATRDREALEQLVAIFDSAYDYYKQVTGREPKPYAKTQYRGRATIAVVPSTCGAGCGYLGTTGIEIQQRFFDELYDDFLAQREFGRIVFYELGRNFWLDAYRNKIEYKAPDHAASVRSGFAVFMRFMAMEGTGIRPRYFNGLDFAVVKAEIQGMLDLYLADPTLNWNNTLRIGQAPRNKQCDSQNLCLKAPDLFAAFLFELRELYGEEFVQKIWKEVEKQPDAQTTQDAVNNFILATSAAAGEDLSDLFVETWRWPLSKFSPNEMSFPESDRIQSIPIGKI